MLQPRCRNIPEEHRINFLIRGQFSPEIPEKNGSGRFFLGLAPFTFNFVKPKIFLGESLWKIKILKKRVNQG